MKRTFSLAALVLLAAAPAPAQRLADHPRVQEAAVALGKWLDAQRAYQRIPGLSAALVVDQEVVWSGGFGWADVARRAPADANTIYSICSISKLFTSVAVMQLRDQGKLRLDDSVARHLPWFTIKNPKPEDGAVTVEGLLTHASGLPREAAYPYWSAPSWEFPTREQVKAAVGSEEMLYRPETFFQYSNLGMSLAGEIVAAVSGTPYADYVRANILNPLGLSSTWSEMPADERGKRLATGYGPWERDGDRRALPFFEARGIAPAAGYASTALDLARFASWQFRLLGQGGREVLSANTLREMQRVHFVDPEWETTWGLGFHTRRFEGQTFTGHDGSCPGYRTTLTMKPDEKVAVIIMTNAIDADAYGMGLQAFGLVGPALKAARADTARKLAAADPGLDKYLGTYVSGWGGETEFIKWEGGLASIDLPADNPGRAITRYRKVGENTFRRIRRDGELAEAVVFELGTDGRAIRTRHNYNMSPRIR